MTKRTLNQNSKFANELLNYIEPDFIFNNKPINRLKASEINNFNSNPNKVENLLTLKKD